MTELVTICCVTHNCLADLPPFFAALDRLRSEIHDPGELRIAFEVVIVDSGSSDGTVEWLRRAACRWPLRLEANARNVGFATGTNRAVDLAREASPWILLLNVDALPDPLAPAALLVALGGASRRGLRASGATGRLVRPNGPGEGGVIDACGMWLAPSWRHFDRGSEEPDRGQYAVAEEVFGGTGAATLFRREALSDVAIGGRVLDEDFFTFREDAELALRLQERGWATLYEPSARFVHRRTNTPGRRRLMSAELNYHTLKNRYLLRLYHQTWRDAPTTILPTVARDIAILLYVLLRERSSLRAYHWLWRERRRLWRRRLLIRARCSHPSRVPFWFRHRSRALPPERSAAMATEAGQRQSGEAG